MTEILFFIIIHEFIKIENCMNIFYNKLMYIFQLGYQLGRGRLYKDGEECRQPMWRGVHGLLSIDVNPL